jgi:hypothetical protein
MVEPISVDQELHLKKEYHRLLLDYEVLVRSFLTSIRNTMQKFADLYEDTHQRHNQYVDIVEMYDKLTDEDDYDDPLDLTHEVSVGGDYVTILPDGESWGRVIFNMRSALHKRQKLTHDFFEDIIEFVITRDAVKHKDFIIEVMHGPKRLIKHLLGYLHYG